MIGHGYGLASILDKTPTDQAVNGSGTAVIFGDQTLTYDELSDRSARLAAGLSALGLAHGDRVGVLMANRMEWFEIFFALARTGAVMVPLNYLLQPPEIAVIAEDAGVSVLIVDVHLVDTARAATVGSAAQLVVVGGEPGSDEFDYEALVDGPPLMTPVARGGDLFLLQFTSGTTGRPKGAMHTHDTVLWNAMHQIVDFGVTSADVYLAVPALCWAAGFHDIALAALWMGGTVVLNPSTGFSPADFFETVERHGVTKTLLVPSVLKRVLLDPGFDDADLTSLQTVYSGGEPVPVESIEDFMHRLPDCALLQAYGMSEFPSMMLYLDEREALRKIGSTGKAVRIADVRIVTAEDIDVAPGEIGEIVVRSPACMVGYYDRPEATAETIVGGWMHTGDLATVDDEGFIFISGRSKDMIITGGLNVYPAEVEAVLAAHPAVEEAAIVGEPDDKWGEIGHAYVTLADTGADRDSSAPSADELVAWLRERVAHFKVPRRYTIEPIALPRTTSGKVQKFRLSDTFEKA